LRALQVAHDPGYEALSSLALLSGTGCPSRATHAAPPERRGRFSLSQRPLRNGHDVLCPDPSLQTSSVPGGDEQPRGLAVGRFPLRHRDGAALLCGRGVLVSYAASRLWCRQGSHASVHARRRRRLQASDTGPRAEVCLPSTLQRQYLVLRTAIAPSGAAHGHYPRYTGVVYCPPQVAPVWRGTQSLSRMEKDNP
jgi:hypothetical protein